MYVYMYIHTHVHIYDCYKVKVLVTQMCLTLQPQGL